MDMMDKIVGFLLGCAGITLISLGGSVVASHTFIGTIIIISGIFVTTSGGVLWYFGRE